MLCPLAVVIREGKQREGARTVFDGVVVPLDSEIVADMRDAAGISDDGQHRGRFHPSPDIGMLERLPGGDLVQLPVSLDHHGANAPTKSHSPNPFRLENAMKSLTKGKARTPGE